MSADMLLRVLARALADEGAEEYALDEFCLPPPEQCGASEDEGGADLWYVGVIISILASVLSNFGVNTQKYSMIQEVVHGRARPYVRQPLWLLGLVGVVLGAVLDFAALGFAAQSLITPVGGFTMVANLFFANYWLGETITRLDLVSTVAIIGGIVLIAVFADKSDQCYTLEALKCLYKRPTFIPYAILVGGFIVLVFVAVVLMRRKRNALRAMEKTESRFYKRIAAVLPLLCALLSGLIGAQSVLFAKSTIEILKSTARGNNEFTSAATYLIILSMFVAIFGQIHWLAAALNDFDAVVIVPVFQSVFVSFTIIAGASYFGEFRDFNLLQKVFFPIGLGVLLVGVLGLAKHKSRTPEELLMLEAESQGLSDGTTSPADDVEGGAAHGASSHNLPHTSSFATVGSQTIQDETRRESFRRYQEFNNLSPYGAVTGRWIPLEFLLSEVESNLERVGNFLHRPSAMDSFSGGEVGHVSGDAQRRTSLPHGPTTLPASARRGFFANWSRAFGRSEDDAEDDDNSDAGSGGPRRTDKSSSFAAVEGMLNFGSSRNVGAHPDLSAFGDSSSDEESEDGDFDDQDGDKQSKAKSRDNRRGR
ncbi:Magnesium transporter NIPA2 [Hondaea fermentalgiana]|uniref:Magnesium transporter NIPA2 n=1 Tax=Hondaea fermentalgiana TaxID=2315210 RepID=A0A2R5H2P9_9STRA|nr:Magnesium transporter NIPA2 [Hondaea fermentalgiana]|eukprot:GBG34674.1 Magnesium transporter NIPA2 [Hondaea fermentalgiana]